MIKGTLQERLDYEDFVRSLKEHIAYPFLNIYKESRKIRRFYRIKVLKEKRDYDTDEIRIINLMCLVTYVARIGGLLYTWLWRERIPEIILTMKSVQSEWWVSPEEMAKIFLQVPAKVLETTLLKSETDSNAIGQALKAHQTENLDALVKILSNIPLDKIFGAFKLITASHQFCEAFSKFSFLEEPRDVLRYSLSDILDILTTKFSQNGESINNTLTVLDRLSEYEYLDLKTDDTREILLELCMGLMMVCELFKEDLGVSDPMTQTMQSIIDEPLFQKIFHMYVQFPRDEERCDDLFKKFIRLINELFGSDVTEDELDIETSTKGNFKQISFKNYKRLEFPTRLLSEVEPTSVSAQDQEKILREIYNIYGGSFENMCCEDFLYLFGAAFNNNMPASYHPPYFWNGEESTMKAIIRILYKRQPPILGKLILHVSDKAKNSTSHDWAQNKKSVSCGNVEKIIMEIIHRITGKTLKELPKD